jgi:hypothetical protein
MEVCEIITKLSGANGDFRVEREKVRFELRVGNI